VPKLPWTVWLAVAAAVAILLALSAASAYAVLRPSARLRVSRWPAWRVVGLFGVAVLPWLVVWLAPLHFEISIHGVGQLLGWLLLALLAFALLVLLPLVSLLCAAVWGISRGRRGTPSPPTT
jgi:hypothetical protein